MISHLHAAWVTQLAMMATFRETWELLVLDRAQECHRAAPGRHGRHGLRTSVH